GVNGGSVTTRQMKAGSALINYSLFSNSGRTMNWGDTVGTDTVSGTGTETAQSLTVYGRIPPQATPSPGTYNDTIVVTLTY
ncbi:MAG: Csu type fimbrial protein, partial [bacterium]